MVLFLVIVLIILVYLIVLIYAKLTSGICRSSRHLVGKVVIVTGANTGIGYETAKDLAERGARVILGCRNDQRGTIARDKIIANTGNKDVHFKKLDLTSLKSVREFTTDVLKTEKRLDILINNAALLTSSAKNGKTEDGLMEVMQVNHFGPFLLICLLLPLLKSSAPSRIINVSSVAHFWGEIDVDNLNMEQKRGKIITDLQVYSDTKLCNVLMTVELARLLKGTGVTTNTLHPGAIDTNIWKNILFIKYISFIFVPFFKTPWEGAQTTIYLAVSPEVEDISGKYFVDCRQKPAIKLADDADLCRKLWSASERLVKIKSN
ncbi:retinol dehydrogenase 11-like [Plodia interpunctella]|uniref:retinol dehydrogenase 11-like n=1 Tax=Plodia interpunctella TaxID=58824 RepID=UPI002368371A|nr:retinol dehydrogenase 11-like [Plodia interpunctella]